MRTGRASRRWDHVDRALALAYTLHLDGLCAHCGQPRDRAYNPDSDGYWSTFVHECLSCQARERRQKLTYEANGKVDKAGVYVGVVDSAPHEHLREWDPMETLRDG